MFVSGSTVKWLRSEASLPLLNSFIAVGFEKSFFTFLSLMYITGIMVILHMLALRIK